MKLRLELRSRGCNPHFFPSVNGVVPDRCADSDLDFEILTVNLRTKLNELWLCWLQL